MVTVEVPSMLQHTLEPWRRESRTSFDNVVGANDHLIVSAEIATHDLERFITCVNACAGRSSATLHAGALVQLKDALRGMFVNGATDGDAFSFSEDDAHEIQSRIEQLWPEITTGGS